MWQRLSGLLLYLENALHSNVAAKSAVALPQAEHLAEQLASLQAAELAAQVLKGELAAAAAAQAEAEAGMSEKAEECAGQAEQLAESAGRHGGLAAQLEELTAKIAASEARLDLIGPFHSIALTSSLLLRVQHQTELLTSTCCCVAGGGRSGTGGGS